MHNTSYNEQDFTNQTPSWNDNNFWLCFPWCYYILYAGRNKSYRTVKSLTVTLSSSCWHYMMSHKRWITGMLCCLHSCWLSLHWVKAYLNKVNLISPLLYCWTRHHPVSDAYAARNHQDSLKVNNVWSLCHCRLMSMWTLLQTPSWYHRHGNLRQ